MRSIYHRFCLLALLLSLSFVFCSFAHARSRDKYVPGELIVKLKEGSQVFNSATTSSTPKSAMSLLELNRKSGVKSSRKLFPGMKRASLTTSFLFRGEVRKTPSLSNIHVLKLPDNIDMEKLAEEYQKDENVVYAEPNYYLYADVIPNDPDFSQQWGLHNTGQYRRPDADIDAPEAWDLETGDSSVIIAIIDSGIDMDHEDLDGKIWTNMGETPDDGTDNDGNGYIDDVRGWDFIDDDNDPSDYLGHGTHVAGIAAAETDNGVGIAGVSWGAKVMNIRILNNSGNGTFSDAADAVIYAAQKGAKVINMSFGNYTYSYLFEDALANAYATSLLVAAAGNDGANAKRCKGKEPHYPSAYDYVVGVGATDVIFDIVAETWIETRASFSNFGVNTDVYAPGANIYSTVPHDNYIAWNGTSMAAPFVSGLAALTFSHYPGSSHEEIRARITQTCDYLGSMTRCDVFEEIYRINTHNAITMVSIPAKVKYVSHIIDDSIGDADNDGIADSGETVNMVFTVKNYGGLATNVVATLRTRADPWTQEPDPFITITSDTASFSAISAYATNDNDGSTGEPGDTPFVFSVASETPNNHPVIFVLDVSADGDYQRSHEFTTYTQRGWEISGVIDEDTTWGGYRYIVVGNVLVMEGVTLTIEPGTEILLDQDKYLMIDGCLQAIGTENNMILFSSNSPNPAPGDGGNIRFTDVSIDAEFDAGGNYVSGSIIKYAEIELVAGIWIHHASPYIAYNFIHDNRGDPNTHPGPFHLENSSSVVEYNLFAENFALGACIFLDACSGLQFSNNVIESNHSGSLGTVTLVCCSSSVVTRNIIRGNDGGPAVFISSSESTCYITYNVIDENISGYAIEFRVDPIYPECTNNTIMNNYSGLGIQTSQPVIAHNNIINNRQGSDGYEIDQTVYHEANAYDVNVQSNYWGTTNTSLIDEWIWDFYDDFGLGKVFYQPFETTPVTDAPGFLYQVSLDPLSPVSIQTVTFNLTFSREMDMGVEPMVTFGVDNPYTQHQVVGDWLDDTHWQGTYDIDIATGDGINTIRATQAEDSDGMEIPKDTRFTFDIDTMSSAAADFMASPGNAQVVLSWSSEGDVPNLAGYSIYRSTQSGGAYQQVNDTLVTGTSYIDTGVTNDTTFYYVMTVMSTDPYESEYSEEVSATPTETATDTTPPTTPVVIDDGEDTTDNTQLHATWSAQDPESGVVEYKYAIGTSQGGVEIVSWQSVGTATSVTKTGLNLVTGVTFYFSVQARNSVDLWSNIGSSNGIEYAIDTTPPETTAALDGTEGENDWYTSNVEVTLTATDDSSGVELTKYRINEEQWEVYISPFEVTGSTVRYYSEDNAGNVEDENQIEVKIDKTPPDTPDVTDDGEYTTDGTQLHATWTSADGESGVVEYQYAIGTVPGGTDVVDWTSTGEDSYVTATSLILTPWETYYFSVKAKNEAGTWSSEGYSDGIMYQYQMDAGWHLISLPRQPGDTGVTSVLSSIADKYDSICSYSPTLGWRWYLTDTPQVSNLSDVVSGVGYWILVEEPCSLPMQGAEPSTEISLSIGWNLVGYTLGESKPIVDCMYSINGEYTSVWEYDPILGWRWYFPASPQTSNLTSMRPGFGYWIKVITNCLWDVSETE